MPDKARILVMDDEPRNVKLLSAHLTGDGFETLAAYNGKQALHLAATENPDVILEAAQNVLPCSGPANS